MVFPKIQLNFQRACDMAKVLETLATDVKIFSLFVLSLIILLLLELVELLEIELQNQELLEWVLCSH
jgi:hypothetical protein